MLINLSYGGSYTVNVAAGTIMSGMQTMISDAIGADIAADVTLQFEDGITYFGGTDVFIVPAGVSNLKINANAGANTQVNMKSITLQSKFTALTFQNLKLNTTSTSTNLVGQSATNYPLSLVVKNCYLTGYRGIFAAAAGEKISVLFDHCTFKTHGSYGVINGGSMLKDVTFSFCTFINLATLFNNNAWIIDANNPFTMKNCTFYNSATQITNGFFRPASNPAAGANIIKNIVASTVDNANGLMYSSSGYSGLDFATSFKTSTYTVAKLSNVQTFTGTALDLFTDPENGNFNFKAGVSGDILLCGALAIDTTTGLTNISKSVFNFYENTVGVEGQAVKLALYSTNGVLVKYTNSNILSYNELNKGVYILMAEIEGQNYVQKLIKSNN